MGEKELVVACVLKTGSFMNKNIRLDYKTEQVRWLKAQVKQHLPLEHSFVCLTDVEIEGVDTIPLADNFPGWWSKIELFKVFESCFYLDLDTVIVGDIADLVTYNHDFTALTNLSNPTSGRIGSGVMAWNRNLRHIYTEFKKNPDKYIKEFVVSHKWGDQGFIEAHQKNIQRFQKLFPGAIKSYVFDLPNKDILPEHCKIVCFHGEPKPWETTHGWVPPMSDA